jgi:hypothetical protein
MAAPSPLFPRDAGIRTHSVNDLEITLVAFIKTIFANTYRLDNPTVNLQQPDVVPFDYTQRAQSLVSKVAPQVVRGRVPRTVSGDINPDDLPNCPAIIVYAHSSEVRITDTIVTVKICVSAYDENPDGSGYQDVLNMIEALAIALTTFGQGAIDKAYPIVMPIEWTRLELHFDPHFIGEMTTKWQLPSGRPMPDFDHNDAPAELLGISMENDTLPPAA